MVHTSNYELHEERVSVENRMEKELKTKGTSCLGKLSIDLDTKHKLLDQGNMKKSSNSSTTTTTRFAPITEIGHSREGSQPRVLHLPSTKGLQAKLGNQKLEKNRLMILKILICLKHIVVGNGDIIICNNNFEITFFKYALSVIKNTSILVFAPYIQNKETPHLNTKEEVVSTLEKRDKVVITDMHSFCGMQSRRVIMPIHLQEKHERQNIIENIARTTNELIMNILDKTSTIFGPEKSTFGRVVKDWEVKKKYRKHFYKIGKKFSRHHMSKVWVANLRNSILLFVTKTLCLPSDDLRVIL